MWARNDTTAHIQEVIQLAFIQIITKFQKLLTHHIAGNQQQQPLAIQMKATAALCLFHFQHWCENVLL